MGDSGDWGLDALTQPLGAARFLDGVWPAELYVGSGAVSRLDALLALPELASVERLIEAVPGLVRVWPGHAMKDEVARLVPSPEALRLYREGWTIYLNQAETHVPALLPLIRRIEADLGLHYGDVNTEVFASIATAGARPHCDFDFGFNVQLHGKKTWRLAPNRSFANPHASVIISDPFDPDVAAYAHGPLPREMPTEGAREVVAEPGTVLFIPRGYWHMTTAHEPSLALTFACKGATWSEWVLRELEVILRQDEAWRAFPDRWVGAGGVTRFAKERDLAALLAALPNIASRLDASTLIAKWSRPRATCYALSPHTKPELLRDPRDPRGRPAAEPGLYVSIAMADGQRRLMRLPEEHVAVVSALVTIRSPFSAADARAMLDLPLAQLQATIDALVAEEVLVEL